MQTVHLTSSSDTAANPSDYALVSWEGPDGVVLPIARFRFLRREARGRLELCYLEGLQLAKPRGFELPPGFDDENGRWQIDAPESFLLQGGRRRDHRHADCGAHLRMMLLGEQMEPLLLLDPDHAETGASLELFHPGRFEHICGGRVHYRMLRGARRLPGAEAALARIDPGERLRLERDFDHPADPRSIFVLGPAGDRLGWLPTDLLEPLNHMAEQGRGYMLFAHRFAEPPAPLASRLVLRLVIGAESSRRGLAGGVFQPLAPSAPPTRWG